MPAAKTLLNLVVGRKRADAISLRPLFLRKFHFLFIILLIMYAMVLSFTIGRLIKKKAPAARPLSYPYLEAVVQPGKQLIAQ
jgi:hypothetical protein